MQNGADARVLHAFRWQAGKCRELGSPFTGALLDEAAGWLDRGSAWAPLVGRWPGEPLDDALPLRVAGALHARFLAGDARLAAHYPADGAAAWRAGEAIAAEDPDGLAAWLRSPPQTNETNRALALFPGLLTVAARFDLPLDLLELGASAGLNLHMDGFGYETPAWRRAGDWRGPPPPLGAPLRVEGRAGCDVNPLDPAGEADRLRLRAYVWADQAARLARLEAALALAAGSGVRVERADAADWLQARLAERRAGATTVIYHSVFWQYPPEPTRRRLSAMIAAAGAAATADAPLAWLRFEPEAGPALRYPLTLTLWPSGETAVLAETDPHGRWVSWRG